MEGKNSRWYEEPKVMYNRPPQIGDNEMPAAELGSSMNDFRQAAGIPVEGMTSVRPLSVYEKGKRYRK